MEDINDSQLYENAPPPVMSYEVDGNNAIPNFRNNFRRNRNFTQIGISHEQLKEIKSEYLIELIEFINFVCNLTIQNKYIDCTYSIFKIIKRRKRNFEIVINKNEAKNYDYKINESDNESNNDSKENIDNENENENNINSINIKKENKKGLSNENTFFCEKHNRLFDNLEKYFSHCRENEEKLICEKCLKGFWKIEKYKDHKCVNIGEKKDNHHQEESEEEDIKCSECDLIFDSVESMSIHYFEKHEKKKQELIKKREEKRKRLEEEKKKKDIFILYKFIFFFHFFNFVSCLLFQELIYSKKSWKPK